MPRVSRNIRTDDDPDWERLTVAVEESNEADDAQVTWNSFERVLIFDDAIKPSATLSNAILVEGKYQAPIVTSVQVQQSYDRVGRWYTERIVDPNIFSDAEARIRMERERREKQYGVATISCTVYQKGSIENGAIDNPLRPGQSIRFTNRGFPGTDENPEGEEINRDYMIDSIQTTFMLGGIPKYDLTLREPFLDHRNESLRRTAPPSAYNVKPAEPPELQVNFPGNSTYTFTSGSSWTLYLPEFEGGTDSNYTAGTDSRNRGDVTGGTQEDSNGNRVDPGTAGASDRGNFDYSVQGRYPTGLNGINYDSLHRTLSTSAGNTVPDGIYNMRYTVIDLDYQLWVLQKLSILRLL